MEKKSMVFFVCKMCGRSVRAPNKPNFCYHDRMNSIENISDEDAVKMGLFTFPEKAMPFRSFLSSEQPLDIILPLTDIHISDIQSIMIEFPGDLLYDPITGKPIVVGYPAGYTLSEFQNHIMKQCKEA
jgi:hypothetical protein